MFDISNSLIIRFLTLSTHAFLLEYYWVEMTEWWYLGTSHCTVCSVQMESSLSEWKKIDLMIFILKHCRKTNWSFLRTECANASECQNTVKESLITQCACLFVSIYSHKVGSRTEKYYTVMYFPELEECKSPNES